MKKIVYLLLLLTFSGFSQVNTDIETIKRKMAIQENCWNKGDIEAFMSPYWKSDSLTFTGKNGINKGWQTTLDNYLTSYPDKKQMGQLAFTNISINKIDQNTITVLGRWSLLRAEDLGDLTGYYSLIWQKKNNVWVIIADHSS